MLNFFCSWHLNLNHRWHSNTYRQHRYRSAFEVFPLISPPPSIIFIHSVPKPESCLPMSGPYKFNIWKQPDGSFQLQKYKLARFAKEPAICIYPEKNGTVWFGTSSDVICYSPGGQAVESTPVSALIRRVFVGRDSVVYDGSGPTEEKRPRLNFPFRLNNVRFEFALPSMPPERKQHLLHRKEQIVPLEVYSKLKAISSHRDRISNH